jgi:hypothetical protein
MALVFLTYLFIIFISIWIKLGLKRIVDALVITCIIAIPFGIMLQLYILLDIDTIYIERAILRI